VNSYNNEDDGFEPQENPGPIEKIDDFFGGGWVLVFLGAPFFAFEFVWPNAHWLIRLAAFVVTFLFFCGVSHDIARGVASGMLSFPWYLPLAVLVYPGVVLNYLAPHASSVFLGTALLCGVPLAWKYWDYITRYEPWVWKCDNCGRQVRTEKDRDPNSMLGGGCRLPSVPEPVPGRQPPVQVRHHEWTLVYREEDPSWSRDTESGDE
jgi:hypothetical protein